MASDAEKEPAKPVPTSTAAKIREHLSTVLTSEIFVRSERLSRFLRYVVERTLEGRGNEIKEYSIGVEVYDRSTAFDPRIDCNPNPTSQGKLFALFPGNCTPVGRN
jgi:hypothetical protein